MNDAALERISELESELHEERLRAQRAERSLARLQTSLPMSIGQLVIEAGTNPRRLPRLPLTLFRIRRDRRRAREGRASIDPDVRTRRQDRASSTAGASRLMLPRRAITLDDRLSILLIAPDEAADRLRRTSHVSTALPHDASALMESLDADMAVIDARVGILGSPWFPLGQPGEGRREESLLSLKNVCVKLGRPLVLVFDPTITPGLIDFAEVCDVVIPPHEWDSHVDLAALLEHVCLPSAVIADGETDA